MASVKDIFPKYLYTFHLTLELYDCSPEHVNTLISAMNSPTAHKFMGDFGVRTQAQWDEFGLKHRLHDARFEGGKADQDLYYLIHLGPNDPKGELIGGISLSQRVAKSGSGTVILPPDIGWCLFEKHMGKGYAAEAGAEVLRSLREDCGRTEITVFASESNPGSNRVAEKLGFVDGGSCPNLDQPGTMYSLYILPGMKRIDDEMKDGLTLVI